MNDFLSALAIILSVGVIFVNGFTDAPNSIATVISTGTLSMGKACLFGSIFNFLGVLVGSLFSLRVADFVISLGSFGDESKKCVSIVFFVVIFFALLCSCFGLPSSESHAMLCAMLGVGLAMGNTENELKKVGTVFVFMCVSSIFALSLGCLSSRLFSKKQSFKLPQILASFLGSFMHGWQDGQKFIGILCALLLGGKGDSFPPFYIILVVSVVMSLGTLIGGKKIIETMGNGIVSLCDRLAFASDLTSSISLLVFSYLGIPVSTSNIKSLAILGVGLGDMQKIKKKAITKILVVSVITFPVCILLGYLIALLFK